MPAVVQMLTAGTPLGGHGALLWRSCHGCVTVCGTPHTPPSLGCAGSCPSVFSASVSEQTYCDRLVQDTPFLTGLGRLSEQQVDRIILQLNRYYPQILSNKDAEKVPRNLRLLSHSFLSELGEGWGGAGQLGGENLSHWGDLGPRTSAF